jgi:opacity protein-like surface antigen
MKKAFLVGIALLALLLSACSALDVVQTDAIRAFGDVLEVFPAEEYEPNRWKLTAPGGGAWFLLDNMNFDLVVDAAPFVAAGADLAKLENVGEHNINPGKDSIYFSSPGFDMLNMNGKDTAMEQFKADIPCVREYLGYHAEMDHYNLDMGGAVFEWAKDMSANDKDIVFALDPEPLIAAGVDPEKVEGWVYTQVPVMRDGKPAQVWKFLKIFDLQ